MSKYVMVDTVSQFRIRYVVEVPDDVGEEMYRGGMASFPITPEEYAMDSVTCEEVREFTQKHLGETIVSTREVTLEEAVAQFRKEESAFGDTWDDETIIKNQITEIGYKQ
jgi:hypothetical protein